MFALIASDTLYIKADSATLDEFAAAGSRPFTYRGKQRPVEMSYWQAPMDAMEDPEALLPWARRGIEAARLGPGADADVTIYNPDSDYQKMFEMPRYVISHGELVVEDGEIRKDRSGKTLHVAPDYDEAAVDDIQNWFEQYYSIQFRNYPVDDDYLGENEIIRSDSP